MDNFKAVYKILRYLERLMDCEDFDRAGFTGERFGVSQERWLRLLGMLADAGYIEGVSVQRAADGHVMVSVGHVSVTLKGLEYLQENTLMRKAANAAKGIVDVVNAIKP
jgi:hypothetical protein